MKHKDYIKAVSQFQIERDAMAYEYLKKEKLNRKLTVLNDYVDFNPAVIGYLIPLIIREQAIHFIFKNKDELNRKFSLPELIDFSKMYNLVSACYENIKSFEDLKNKYKKIKP